MLKDNVAAIINNQAVILGVVLIVFLAIMIGVEMAALSIRKCRIFPFYIIDKAKTNKEKLERINFLYKDENFGEYMEEANVDSRLDNLYKRMDFLKRTLLLSDSLYASMDAFLISTLVSYATSFSDKLPFVVLIASILILYIIVFFILFAAKKYYSSQNAAYEYEKVLLQEKIEMEQRNMGFKECTREIFEKMKREAVK